MLFLIWLLKNHPGVKFSDVCREVTLQSTGQLAYPDGDIRLWAQQKRQRISENLRSGAQPIRGLAYPPEYTPFDTFLQPTDIFDNNYFHSPAIQLNQNITMAKSSHLTSPSDELSVQLPNKVSAEQFMVELVAEVKEKNNHQDQFVPTEASIVQLAIFDGDDNPVHEILKGPNAKHLYDVLNRDGDSTSNQLTCRANLQEVNEMYGASTVSLQTYGISGKQFQLVRLEEWVDGEFAQHHEEQVSDEADLIFGENKKRSIAYARDSEQALKGARHQRWIQKVVYYLLPNSKNGKPLEYSNEHFSEELLGWDEDDGETRPAFADNPPSDPEQLFASHKITQTDFTLDGDSEEEVNDDMGDTATASAKTVIGVAKASIIFQLTVKGSSGGRNKKSATMSPVRGRAAVGTKFTPTRQG